MENIVMFIILVGALVVFLSFLVATDDDFFEKRREYKLKKIELKIKERELRLRERK